MKSAVKCILHEPFIYERSIFWDRKFSFVQEVKESEGYTYKVLALFPLVEEAYRDFFRDEIP